MTSKTSLYISIAVIVVYWALAATIANRESMPPPNDLGAIVGSILLVKFSVLAAVLLFLGLEKEPLESMTKLANGNR